MEPTENTQPPLAVSKITISAPPSSGFRPRASSRVLGGELADRLSVSCPEAPPRAALVQAVFSEQIASVQTRAIEYPMRTIHDAIRRARHRTRRSEHHAQQTGF